MVKLLQAIFDRIFAVAGALLFSQLPHYFHAYTQRLGGHLGELGMQMKTLQDAAARSGKTLGLYIEKFVNNPDGDIALQGEFMQSLIARFSEIGSAYRAMVEASPLTRPMHFLQTFQPDVAKLTLHDFSFGLELTPETGIYALIGMGAGMLLFALMNGLLAFLRVGFSSGFCGLKTLFRKTYA